MKQPITVVCLVVCTLVCLAVPINAQDQVFTNTLGMRFIPVPSGQFYMGSPKSEIGHTRDETRHTVFISKGFYIQETEMTQGQWKRLVGFNPSAFPECGDNCPVDTVSWEECMEFIRVLNQYEDTTKYRLPTEAEWEYACRAGTTTAFSSGPITTTSCKVIEPALDLVGWYCANSGYKDPPDDFRPHPVKAKKPNPWGLYDMHGNVQEWVLDSCKWRDRLRGRVGVITTTYRDKIVDPLSTKGDRRIFKGGGWHQNPKYCRSAYRSYYKPVAKRNSLGFRIVRER